MIIDFNGGIRSSHYVLWGQTANGPVYVLIGWIEILSHFFLYIEPRRGQPLYCYLDELDPISMTLEDYQIVLDRFGISNISLKPGYGLYESLMTDREICLSPTCI
jgi:hypothetical protein